MTPAYAIVVNGTPITALVSPRLISLTVNDKRGLEADQLDLELADHDGLLDLPPKGAKILLSLGSDGILTPIGEFTVDEVEHSGAPDRLTIRARSADLRGKFAAKRDLSYHGKTLGAIVREIAGRQGLTAVIGQALDGTAVAHLDQTKESDAALLSRLAEDYDAIATVKAGRLVFSARGAGTSASGQALAAVTLTRADGDRHRWSQSERDAYTGVVAEWRDAKGAKKQEAVAGSDENPKRLRPIYADEAGARRAAQSEWQRLQRGVATFELTLSTARLDLGPETPLRVIGFKSAIDAAAWIVTEATHRLDDAGGFATTVQAELRAG